MDSHHPLQLNHPGPHWRRYPDPACWNPHQHHPVDLPSAACPQNNGTLAHPDGVVQHLILRGTDWEQGTAKYNGVGVGQSHQYTYEGCSKSCVGDQRGFVEHLCTATMLRITECQTASCASLEIPPRLKTPDSGEGWCLRTSRAVGTLLGEVWLRPRRGGAGLM